MNDSDTHSNCARQTLRSLIRQTPGESFASLSRYLGRNHAYIQQHIQRGQPQFLSAPDRRKIAARLGVDPDCLSPGRGAPASGMSESNDRIVFIPMICRTGDADGFTAPGQTPGSDSLPVRLSMFAGLGVDSSDSVVACLARGDSMTPTISDGDLLLVDRATCKAESDGLYMIRVSGTGAVEKRISVNPVTGRLTLRSDNPLYPVWPDCPPEQVRIVGRIIWQGRRL